MSYKAHDSLNIQIEMSQKIYSKGAERRNSMDEPIDNHSEDNEIGEKTLQNLSNTLGFGGEKETDNAPKMPFYKVLWLFLGFGCRAFGGPAAQIAMMKEELVDEAQWISPEYFNKVFAVYQIVPGPEATELACFFGR